MNVVDSSCWLSYFAGDSNSEVFSQPIEALDELIVPTITITEVFKNILRQRDEDSALAAIAHMELGRIISLDTDLAIKYNSVIQLNNLKRIAIYLSNSVKGA